MALALATQRDVRAGGLMETAPTAFWLLKINATTAMPIAGVFAGGNRLARASADAVHSRRQPPVFSGNLKAMARVTVEDCLQNVDNLFQLVLLASQRARRLANGAEPTVPIENDKADGAGAARDRRRQHHARDAARAGAAAGVRGARAPSTNRPSAHRSSGWSIASSRDPRARTRGGCGLCVFAVGVAARRETRHSGCQGAAG